jgi:hypothetical protein
MNVIATNRNDITAIILARIDNLENIMGVLGHSDSLPASRFVLLCGVVHKEGAGAMAVVLVGPASLRGRAVSKRNEWFWCASKGAGANSRFTAKL